MAVYLMGRLVLSGKSADRLLWPSFITFCSNFPYQDWSAVSEFIESQHTVPKLIKMLPTCNSVYEGVRNRG